MNSSILSSIIPSTFVSFDTDEGDAAGVAMPNGVEGAWDVGLSL